MPKLPPDQVIRHEVVLGRAEREMIRNTVESIQFRNFSSPIVAGLSDVTFTATIAGLLAILLGKALDDLGLDPDWREITKDMTPEQVKDWLETQNIVVGGVLALLVALSGGTALGVVGAGIAGSAAVEGAEAGYEALDQAARNNSTTASFIAWWQSLNLPAWAQSDGGLGSQGL